MALFAEIRAAQAELSERVDRRGKAPVGPQPIAVDLNRFAAGLKTAWREGEQRPTHRRPYRRRKPAPRRPYGVSFGCRLTPCLPIPMKAPVCHGMLAPRDSWMMPSPCNEMIPRGAPRLLAERVSSSVVVFGQAVLDDLPRARRRLSPFNSIRWALWTKRSRMASP